MYNPNNPFKPCIYQISMTNIKITSKIEELEGEIINGKVTPFGTSAHIPFSKKHIGKKIKIIIPEEPNYIWILSDKDKQLALKSAEKYIKEQNGKFEHHRLGVLDNIKENDFNIDDLLKLIRFLIESGNQSIGLKIKKIYNL